MQAQAAQQPAPVPSKALTPMQKDAAKIQDFLKRKQGSFEGLLPAHLKPEKMMKGFWAAASRNPKIVQCTPESVLNCFLVSASLGLEIGRLRGGMHVVPFSNKGVLTLTPIPDYRGLMDLAFRSGQVLGIRAVPVYEGDEFEYAEGTVDGIKHIPKLDADRSPGKLRLVYAVAHLKDARPQFVVMTKQEVEQHRNRSRAKDAGPWVTDYVAMALKTAIKSLCNWLPAAPEKLIQAVELDDRAERGEDMAGVFDFELAPEPQGEDQDSRTGKVMDDLRSRKGSNEADTTGTETKADPPPPPPPPPAAADQAEDFAVNFEHAEQAMAAAPKLGMKNAKYDAFKKVIEGAFVNADAGDWWAQTGRGMWVEASDPKVKEAMAALARFYIGPRFAAE